MLRSGIPLQRALEHLAQGRGRVAHSARIAAPLVNQDLRLAFTSGGFSALDTGVLSSGEQSGRLVEACEELGSCYARLSAGRRRALAAAAYPVFVLHLGAILLSIPPAILEGGFPAFARSAGTFLGGAYLAIAVACAAAWLSGRLFASHVSADRILSGIPVIGGFLRCAALARFCLVLSLGIRSAEGFLAGLTRAGACSGSARIRRASEEAVAAIRSGSGFAEAIRSTRAFPPDLESIFQTAEVSGRLEEEVTRWARIFRDRTFERIEALSAWLPRLLYLMVLLLVAFRIFALASQVTGAFSGALDMSGG